MVKYDEKGLQELKDDAIGMLSPANIDQLANTLGKSLKSFLEDKQGKISDLKEQYESSIKAHPLPAVATALTAGIIIGLLCRRG